MPLAARDGRRHAGLHVRPLGQQRALHHRVDQPPDGRGVGVVGSQLAALGRVQPALEQGAEDAGVDGAPVQRAGGLQGDQVGSGQRRHLDLREQATVEPGHVVDAEQAAVAHGCKQRLQLRAQALGCGLHAHQAFEQARGQQAHVLGEEAEHALGEEVADLRRRHAGLVQALGGAGEGARGFLGDVAVAAARLVAVRRLPQSAQALLHLGPDDVFQSEGMALAGRAGEVGVNLDAQAVADHQQRRVFQRQRVHHQLAQRAFQALARGFVLPRKVALEPDVGKAIGAPAATGLRQAALEAVALGVARFFHAKNAAQVDEVSLRAGTLVQARRRPARAPLGNEIARLHRRVSAPVWAARPTARPAPGPAPRCRAAPRRRARRGAAPTGRRRPGGAGPSGASRCR